MSQYKSVFKLVFAGAGVVNASVFSHFSTNCTQYVNNLIFCVHSQNLSTPVRSVTSAQLSGHTSALQWSARHFIVPVWLVHFCVSSTGKGTYASSQFVNGSDLEATVKPSAGHFSDMPFVISLEKTLTNCKLKVKIPKPCDRSRICDLP